MTIGHVSNMNYIAAAGRANSPTMRPATSIFPSPTSAVIPVTNGSNALYLSPDGDRAEISGRARGLSVFEQNQQPIGPGLVNNYQFNTPSPLIDWSILNINPSINPASLIIPSNAPSSNTPVAGTSDVQISEAAREALLEALEPQGVCHTCENRKYVDQSDDASVSFQTPTSVSPNMAAAAVASHEQEHVRNEQAKADRDDREIVNQSVTLHYDTCPECGKQYVSGGTTKTTSISKSDSDDLMPEDAQSGNNNQE